MPGPKVRAPATTSVDRGPKLTPLVSPRDAAGTMRSTGPSPAGAPVCRPTHLVLGRFTNGNLVDAPGNHGFKFASDQYYHDDLGGFNVMGTLQGPTVIAIKRAAVCGPLLLLVGLS